MIYCAKSDLHLDCDPKFSSALFYNQCSRVIIASEIETKLKLDLDLVVVVVSKRLLVQFLVF